VVVHFADFSSSLSYYSWTAVTASSAQMLMHELISSSDNWF